MADVDKCLYKRLEGTHKVQVGWSVWKLSSNMDVGKKIRDRI